MTAFIPCIRDNVFYVLTADVLDDQDNSHVLVEEKGTFYSSSLQIKDAYDIYQNKVDYVIFYSAFLNENKILNASGDLERTEYLVGGIKDSKDQKYFSNFLSTVEYIVFNYLTLGICKHLCFIDKSVLHRKTEVKSYYENGNLHIVSQRKGGKRNGIEEEYDLLTRKIKNYNYVSNKKDGICYDSLFNNKEDKTDKTLIYECYTNFLKDKKYEKSTKYSCKIDNFYSSVRSFEESTYENDQIVEKLFYEENTFGEWYKINYVNGIEGKRTDYVCKDGISFGVSGLGNEGHTLNFTEIYKTSYVRSKTISGMKKVFVA
jgi:antitoxin component YwqK of YwqJK toxin-antitoxin module